jgi:hypothetical protein
MGWDGMCKPGGGVMPAYRSEAEAEVRGAVVEQLRLIRPNARIIHEINTCQGGNRVDVLAVDTAEIIAVEVKSEKDKLDRLTDQINGMRGVAHHSIAAIHEKFLVEQEVNKFVSEYERGGKHFALRLPIQARRVPTWVYPRKQRCKNATYDFLARWDEPEPSIQSALPQSALHILWRDELYDLCGQLGVVVPKRANMKLMNSAIRWQCSGSQITRGICAALRRRECIEADPPLQTGRGCDV